MSYLIGDPSRQDNNEMEWPLYHNDALIAFFPNKPAAVRAGENLDAVADCAAGNTDTLYRCPKCGEIDQSGLDFVCATCADTSHRCAAGHALEDDGSCGACGDEWEEAENERIRREAYALNALPETDENRRILEIGRRIIQQIIAERFACRACGGAHHTQQCPDIRARLFADDPLLVEAPYALLEV